MKKRFFRLGKWVLLAVAAGLCYAAFVGLTGWGVPCLFYKITGLNCPGCGVSRMCMALLRLDLSAAFHANAAICCLLPVWVVLFGAQAVRYVRSGTRTWLLWQNILVWISIVVLLAFGVWRNLPTVRALIGV